MFNVDNKDSRTMSNIVLVSLMLTLNIFGSSFSISVDDFEQINICWLIDFEHVEHSIQCVNQVIFQVSA